MRATNKTKLNERKAKKEFELRKAKLIAAFNALNKESPQRQRVDQFGGISVLNGFTEMSQVIKCEKTLATSDEELNLAMELEPKYWALPEDDQIRISFGKIIEKDGDLNLRTLRILKNLFLQRDQQEKAAQEKISQTPPAVIIPSNPEPEITVQSSEPSVPLIVSSDPLIALRKIYRSVHENSKETPTPDELQKLKATPRDENFWKLMREGLMAFKAQAFSSALIQHGIIQMIKDTQQKTSTNDEFYIKFITDLSALGNNSKLFSPAKSPTENATQTTVRENTNNYGR